MSRPQRVPRQPLRLRTATSASPFRLENLSAGIRSLKAFANTDELISFPLVPSPSDPRGLTRREMLSKLFQPMRKAASAIQSDPALKPAETATSENASGAYSHIAVIAGRHCLAYQGTSCTTCVEHCPIDGALLLEKGLPRVVSSICTGCRLCQEACPAPQEAIRIVPRPPGLPPPPPPPTTNIQAQKSAFPLLPPRTPPEHG